MVYGIVPMEGQTQEGLAEERLWRAALRRRDQGTGNRERRAGRGGDQGGSGSGGAG